MRVFIIFLIFQLVLDLFAMSFADFCCGVFYARDHVLNVLFGQAWMHWQIGFAFIKEFAGDWALIGVVTHSLQSSEMECRLIMSELLTLLCF